MLVAHVKAAAIAVIHVKVAIVATHVILVLVVNVPVAVEVRSIVLAVVSLLVTEPQAAG